MSKWVFFKLPNTIWCVNIALRAGRITPLGEHRNQGRQDHGVRILSYNLNKYIQVTPNETFFQNMTHIILVLAICQQSFQELNSNLGKNSLFVYDKSFFPYSFLTPTWCIYGPFTTGHKKFPKKSRKYRETNMLRFGPNPGRMLYLGTI